MDLHASQSPALRARLRRSPIQLQAWKNVLLLTVVAEASQTGDSDDRAMLDDLTPNWSGMMDRIRKQLLEGAAPPGLEPAA
ncbi:MAG: hypothetical protein AB7O49_09335 [Sphingomonadales bacterium]